MLKKLKANRRFTTQNKGKRKLSIAPDDMRSALGETIFPSTRKRADEVVNILKEGKNSRKIGSHITKGRWRGMPIYTLTLEERATCPRTCREWANCYGNNMQWSQRMQPGHDLTAGLEAELRDLNSRFNRGFAVRLHVLGDFYHSNYVYFWAHMLDQLKHLHIFGFTAHNPDYEMGELIHKLNSLFSDRFHIRFSGIDTEVIETQDQATGILCPVQMDKSDCCGTCTLCWQTKNKISFLQH